MSDTIPLGEVVEVSAGQPAPRPTDFSADGHPFIRAGSVDRLLNGSTENDCEKVAPAIAKNYRLKLFPKDTVVFAKSGMSAKIGRIYRLRQPAYVVSHLATLVPTGKYDPAFLTYWLRQHPPSKLINDDAYPSIRVSAIADLQVPDLPIGEQSRIAAILDKADAIHRKREQALALAHDLLKSTFLEMFGDLEYNNKNWPTESLEALLPISPQNGLYKPSSDYGSGIRILRIDGFYNGYLEDEVIFKRLAVTDAELAKYKLNNGDVVINRVNSRKYLGKSALIEGLSEPTVFESNMMRFAVATEELEPRFLVDQLQTEYIKRQILTCSKDAVNQSSINQRDVEFLRIRKPPIELQRNYARFVKRTQAGRRRQIEALQEVSLLFASLSQRAFRGEL
jgi:type I restriction enzyme S subunit